MSKEGEASHDRVRAQSRYIYTRTCRHVQLCACNAYIHTYMPREGHYVHKYTSYVCIQEVEMQTTGTMCRERTREKGPR